MLNDRPDKCSSCDYFIPSSPRNCTIFLDLYDLEKKNGVIAPITECEHYHERVAYHERVVYCG